MVKDYAFMLLLLVSCKSLDFTVAEVSVRDDCAGDCLWNGIFVVRVGNYNQPKHCGCVFACVLIDNSPFLHTTCIFSGCMGVPERNR